MPITVFAHIGPGVQILFSITAHSVDTRVSGLLHTCGTCHTSIRVAGFTVYRICWAINAPGYVISSFAVFFEGVFIEGVFAILVHARWTAITHVAFRVLMRGTCETAFVVAGSAGIAKAITAVHVVVHILTFVA